MNLNTPLSSLTGIGPSLAYKLSKLELLTVEDLIYHFPFRYDDFSQIVSAVEASVGEKVTLKGEIWSIKNIFTRSKKIITQAIFNDGTTSIELTWFNQSWLTKQIQTGDRLQISGKLTRYKNKLSIIAPAWEKIAADTLTNQPATHTLHTGKLVSIYPETSGLTSKWLRSNIDQILPQFLDQIKDPLPLLIKNQMLDLPQALNKIHFPQNLEEASRAKERLSFDELFFIQLATQKARVDWKKKPLIEKFKIDTQKLNLFIKSLTFSLTKAQKKVIDEILEDLKKDVPMNRLVQGEVGSGKTVVAAIIVYLTHLNKLKTLFMAPTEILAFQHFTTLSQLLKPYSIKVGIYTGSRKKAENSDVIIGTHALLSDKLLTPNVGLIIVDEQQRFGVGQRSLLRSKAKVPHFLSLTATPIPRTVALTLYGDLDLSIIDELPKGRKLVKTYVVPNKKRVDAYVFISKQVESGGQVYIITPLIEPSETLATVKSAKQEFERLQRQVFSNLKLGLLHGRLKSKEKEQVLNDFKEKRIDILVSTSVVEVGVDVTNATVMVIEGAERFGLAQLHQLRGRVGRGDKQSYCLLFPSSQDTSIVSRLKNLEKIYDGLRLAELDLKIRGSGEIFGVAQSGRWEFKIADLTDLKLIEKTKTAAERLLQNDTTLDNYPLLAAKLSDLAQEVMPD